MDKKYIESIAVEYVPAYKLAECLSLKYKNTEEKETAPERADEVTEEFKQHIYFFDEEQIKFMSDFIEKTQTGGLIVENDKIDLAGLFPYDYFFAYLHDDKLYLVLPDELRDIYIETIAEDNFESIRKLNREMLKYAVALTNLYGAYEIEQFVTVWNQHHKDKIDYYAAEKFLNKSSDYTLEYLQEDDYVFSDSLYSDEETDDLLDKVEYLKYYMPTKSVINLYSEDDYYEKIPEAITMAEFLNRYVPNDTFLGDTLRLNIIYDCKRLEKPIEIVNILHGYGFPVEDKEAMKEFERLYQNLLNNTHIWEFRGFTPPQYENETGKQVKPFKIPEFERVEKGKKKKR